MQFKVRKLPADFGALAIRGDALWCNLKLTGEAMMPSNGERSSTNGNSIGTSVTLWFPNIFKIIGVMTAAATSIRSRECFSAAALSAATKRSPAQTKNSGQGVDGRVPSNTADVRVSSPIIAVKSSLILSLDDDKTFGAQVFKYFQQFFRR